MLDDRVEQQRVDGAGRGAHGGIVMMMALTVSGAFPSGSMVTAACPVTGILATGGGGVSFLVCVGAGDNSLAGWRSVVDESEEVRLRAKMGRRCYTSPWASLRNDERVWRW